MADDPKTPDTKTPDAKNPDPRMSDPVAPPAVGSADDLPPLGRSGRGAQNVLDGVARDAARGAIHGSIEGNIMARDAAVGRGEAGDGTTPDGSTPDGRLPPDALGRTVHAPFGEPGEGEGKPGSRPGDEAIAEAERKALEERARKQEAVVREAAARTTADQGQK